MLQRQTVPVGANHSLLPGSGRMRGVMVSPMHLQWTLIELPHSCSLQQQHSLSASTASSEGSAEA